jgi:hypothetical protein
MSVQYCGIRINHRPFDNLGFNENTAMETKLLTAPGRRWPTGTVSPWPRIAARKAKKPPKGKALLPSVRSFP